MALEFEQLDQLAGGAWSTLVVCPLCSASRHFVHHRTQKVLRIYRNNDGTIGYKCHHCGEQAVVYPPKNGVARPMPPKVAQPDNRAKANDLWQRSKLISGTLAEKYLRSRKCFIETPNIRYLPASRRFLPTMIARFASGNGKTYGVHLTRMNEEGTAKAKIEKPKIMLGPSSGWPIIVVPDAVEDTTVAIAEGIEDAASMALAFGCRAWAAGSAGRIPGVVMKVPARWRVVLATDADDAGMKALEDARRVRPDLLSIDCTGALNSEVKIDPNWVLRSRGVEALRQIRDWCVGAAMEPEDDYADRAEWKARAS